MILFEHVSDLSEQPTSDWIYLLFCFRFRVIDSNPHHRRLDASCSIAYYCEMCDACFGNHSRVFEYATNL